MRVRQLILNTVAIAALGTTCFGQSVRTQSHDQEERQEQQVEKQNEALKNESFSFVPNTSIIDNDADSFVSKSRAPGS